MSDIKIRHAEKADGGEVHRLIQRCPPLDVNSAYSYFLLCTDFSSTCLVAEKDADVVGFISAYRLPAKNDTLFIWQVAVASEVRGKGVASKLLHTLVNTASQQTPLTAIETTISPSNTPSRTLFTRFAKSYPGEITLLPFLEASDFGNDDHEAEERFHIKLKPKS